MPFATKGVMPSAVMLLGLLIGTALKASGPQNERLLRRNHYARKAGEAATRGQLAEAIRYYGKVLAIQPQDRLGQYNLACALSRDGQTDAALDALEQCIALGYDDSGHLGEDPDLVPLQGTARFTALVAAAEQCRGETVAYSVPGVAPDKPLVVAFHNYGGHSRACVATWREAATRVQAAVIAPRGPVELSARGTVFYGWSARRAPSVEDVAAAGEQVAATLTELSVPGDRVVLAGRGQGAGMALEILRGRVAEVRGAVLVGPLAPPTGEWTQWPSGSVPRVAILAGSQNPEAANELATALRYAGCKVHVIETPGTLAVLPADATRLLGEGLAFVFSE